MKLPDLPSIQGKRFEFETLQYNTLSLMEQATRAKTGIGSRYDTWVSFA